ALKHPSLPPPAAAPQAPAAAALGAAGIDPAVRVRHILQQVDAFRHAKDYDHAVAKLFEGIEQLPQARELREKLCDVYIEAGDQAEAVRPMLRLARWLAANNDVETTTRILDEGLLLEPAQPDAIAMLRELGYTIAPEDAAAEAQPAYVDDAMAAGSTYDPQAPL